MAQTISARMISTTRPISGAYRLRMLPAPVIASRSIGSFSVGAGFGLPAGVTDSAGGAATGPPPGLTCSAGNGGGGGGGSYA
jgi:hypothetical protein